MRRHLLLLTVAITAVASAAQAQPMAGSVDPDVPTQVAPVTVFATRTQTRVDEAPATVSVITDEDIERLLVTDIKDLVRYEPGVSVVSQPARFGAALGTAGRAGNEGFTIRGLGGDRVLMVVDGVRTPDGFVFGAQSVGRGGYSDLDLMKSVEILRGPASALYGSDGVAGAVSFTTKDPADLLTGGRDFAARARIGYTSADDGWTEGLAMAGQTAVLSGLLAYTRRDAHETETQGTRSGEEVTAVGDPAVPTLVYSSRTKANPQTIGSDALLAKLVWDVTPDQTLGLTYDGYRLEMDADVLSGRTTRPVAAPPTAATAVLALRAEDETRRDRVQLDWRSRGVFGLDRTHIAAYWQDAETRQFTFEDRVGIDRTRDNQFNNRVHGLAADAVRTLNLGGLTHRLTFGGDGSETRQEGIRDGTVPPAGETFPTSPFPRTDYRLAGAFIQDEITLLNGRLRITPALRWDTYALSTASDPLYVGQRADQSDDRLSPKIGVVWWTTPTFGLFANYAEGFKAPTPSQVNNGFSNAAFGYVSASNPDLRPETSRSVEAGLRMRDIDFAFGRMGFQAVAFRSEFDDFISQQVVSGSFTPADPAVYQFVNFTEVTIRGLEGRATVDWENGWGLRASAAWADGETNSGGATTKLASIDPIKLVGGLRWDEPQGRFGGEAVVTWSDGKRARDTDGLACFNAAPINGCYVGEAFTLVDLTAYWNVNARVTARSGVFNVLDETYSWWSDIRGLSNASTVTDAYTQPGRNVGLSLSLRL
jgi:hemoglobin/transferrin/lactoferrin receptor protein